VNNTVKKRLGLRPTDISQKKPEVERDNRLQGSPRRHTYNRRDEAGQSRNIMVQLKKTQRINRKGKQLSKPKEGEKKKNFRKGA